MKRTLAMLALLIPLAACDDGTPVAVEDSPRLAPQQSFALLHNPVPESWGPIASPPPFRFAPPIAVRAAAADNALSPDLVEATLLPGETLTEHKVVTLGEAPPRGDVMFAIDLTGSMGGELANVKVNASNIMTAVAGLIPDVQFGLISYMDYNGVFTTSVAGGQTCNYTSSYGSGPDVPYRLDTSLTTDLTSVASAISGLVLGFGNDGPESYSRVFYESYAELVGDVNPTFGPLGWRTGATKIVVSFLDAVPHDCDYDAILGGTADSGHDPGRDEIVGTADDLHILSVLGGMAANDVTLVNLSSDGGFFTPLWDAYAGVTGGVNFAINPDGTFPGGIDPATQIAQLIQQAVSTIDNLVLQLCPGSEGFGDWIVGVEPPSRSGITLPSTETFDVELGPPAGTAAGVYEFEICANGDGAEFGRQTVRITVPVDTRRMTGGGSVFDAAGTRFTHGFTLRCDATVGPNNLQINWNDGSGSKSFHLESLDVPAVCTDDPAIGPAPPKAPFDTYVGSGTGRLNGVAGALISFRFTDAGEPGKGVDIASMSITPPGGGPAITVTNTLDKGNHQAHR